MFSNGQITFGILFAIAFAIIIYFMYRKDINVHKKHFKGSAWVLLGFIGFILMIVAIKFIFV
ncbi:MAG: hypothetical protein BM564_05145 [Bacteroidetes bacterium MedPE-SWsnd-G2]|nr:MAG: hypothetical protein BM564_05145 [Bacteroidetes bacterium MedPE-SWsnd-G2]